MSNFNLPVNMTRYSTFNDFEKTLTPVVTSMESLMQTLNLENTGLTMVKANSSLFGSSITAPNSTIYTTFNCPKTWEPILMTEEAIAERNRIYQKLHEKTFQGETIFPKEEFIHRAFEECPLDKLKVVIIGQDPYHKIDNKLNVEIASGLAFSGLYGGEKPSSMNKIFAELRRTWPGIILDHCELTSWAQQGVLLLNTSLTVRMGVANSHGKEKLWKYYIEYILRRIYERCPNVVFLLWGSHAKELAERSNDPPIGSKAKVLKCGHPSGINTSKNKESMFDENGHFSAIFYYINQQNEEIWKKNQILEKAGQPLLPYVDQIDWSLTHEKYNEIRNIKMYERQLLQQQVSQGQNLESGQIGGNEGQQKNLQIQETVDSDLPQLEVDTNELKIRQYQERLNQIMAFSYNLEQVQYLRSQGYTDEHIIYYQNNYKMQLKEQLDKEFS